MSTPVLTRDLIVVGASMGGIEALKQLVTDLPPDLPAAILIVQHLAAEAPGELAGILDRRCALPVAFAHDGLGIEHGHVYLAPPDRHLLVDGERLRTLAGPRENRARPSVDALFRTAAVSARTRAVGVILTGLLGDGASGLLAIATCGGMTVAQSDALHAEMPDGARAAVDVDHDVPLAEIGGLLEALAGTPALPPPPVPADLAVEARLTLETFTDGDWLAVPGTSTEFTCPECGGALRRIDEEGTCRFRCHTGHAYSEQALIDGQRVAVERALWAALRAMEERALMLDRLDDRHGSDTSGFADRAAEARAHAGAIRNLLR